MRNFRADMLAVIEGRPTERIPWVPRLDLWHRANKLAGSMPPGLENATLEEVCDALDAGLHCIIPDFRSVNASEVELDRGLGLYHLLPAISPRKSGNIWSGCSRSP